MLDKRSSNITSTVMTVTPEMATKWLEGNVRNRVLRDRVVDTYARAMRNHQWQLNGESIIFDNEGYLANGQHRLWACLKAGVAFQAVVVSGIAPEAFPTMDKGARRSTGDDLYIAGPGKDVNRMLLAAMAQQVWKYQNSNVMSTASAPHDELVQLVQDNPSIIEWAKRGAHLPNSLKGYGTAMTAVCALGSLGYPEKAVEFFSRFVDGMNLDTGSPILTLRNRVLSGNKTHRGWERLFLVTSAWNAFVQERKLTKMNSAPRIGSDFPKILGS
ncbi:MAG TPA: hypothetical protein VK575_09425 [Gemmatimonadaceae bacterium]|nr:hypothetical protein [Gemmatimonadaceae bacterium]